MKNSSKSFNPSFFSSFLLLFLNLYISCLLIEMKPICKLLVYVTLLLLPVSIISLPECNFPAVFNFGDSNSDTGALVAMFGQAAARPPNGETFFGSPAGRVCDGRLLIDFIGTYSEYTHSISCRFFFFFLNGKTKKIFLFDQNL
ncbi:putative alpha-L-fucosidase [Helianthus anomalus]